MRSPVGVGIFVLGTIIHLAFDNLKTTEGGVGSSCCRSRAWSHLDRTEPSCLYLPIQGLSGSLGF